MILTERFFLAPVTPEDAERIRLLAGDEAVASSALNIPHPFEEGMAEEWIGGLKTDDVVLAIRQKGEDPLIGMISLIRDEVNESAELSYWIGRPYWGSGFASEAAMVVVVYGFHSLVLNRIFAATLGRNALSVRVLEKAGFTPEGCLRRHVKHRGKFEGLLYHGLLREDLEKRNKRGMITYLGPEDMQAVLALASQVEGLFGPMVGVADFETGLQDCLKTNRVLGCKEQNEICGAAILDRNGNELR